MNGESWTRVSIHPVQSAIRLGFATHSSIFYSSSNFTCASLNFSNYLLTGDAVAELIDVDELCVVVSEFYQSLPRSRRQRLGEVPSLMDLSSDTDNTMSRRDGEVRL